MAPIYSYNTWVAAIQTRVRHSIKHMRRIYQSFSRACKSTSFPVFRRFQRLCLERTPWSVAEDSRFQVLPSPCLPQSLRRAITPKLYRVSASASPLWARAFCLLRTLRLSRLSAKPNLTLRFPHFSSKISKISNSYHFKNKYYRLVTKY